MFKKIKWLCVIGIIGIMGIMGIIVTSGISDFATENALSHYEPYSSWAKDVGFKHNLIFLEKPQRPALRWEIVNLLDSISEKEAKSDVNKEINFTDLTDVPGDVRQKIIVAVQKGRVSGYSDKTFRPFSEVSRGEFVALLDRYGMLENSTKSSYKKFSDVENHWSKAYAYKAVAAGIISGKNENNFCPDDTITLEEILIILNRMENNKQITDVEVINAILDTFPARQYDNFEKYMVEDIYGDMEQVQHNMWVYKNSLPGYDFTNIGRTLELEDVLIWKYYYDNNTSINSYSVSKPQLSDSNKKVYFSNLYKKHINGTDFDEYYFGILPGQNIDYTKKVTVKEFLHSLSLRNSDVSNIEVNFSNFSTFSEEEKTDVRNAIYFELIPNSTNEFPINDYMTSALLNYITVKRNHCQPLYKKEPLDIFTSSYYMSEAFDSEGRVYHTEMDENTWPNNYEQYPFIMRPFSNEAYEIPFIGADAEGSLTPIEYYNTQSMPSDKAAKEYINTVINVDYTTINAEELCNKINKMSCYSYTPNMIQSYVDYVKEHKIKLEGNCYSCIPIVYYDASFLGRVRMRFNVKFKVISSDTNKNLLLADEGIFSNVPNKNLEYVGNEFEFYVDFQYVWNKTRYDIEGMLSLFDDITLQKVGSIVTNRYE